MKRLSLAIVLVLGVVGTAIAYPPLKVGKATDTKITLKNLNCNHRYKIRVSERRGGKWAQTQTVKRKTKPCPPPPPPPSAGGFPNPQSAGTPPTWVPQSTTSSDVTLSTPGQVYHDVELLGGANIGVTAPNVTIRNVKLDGGYINNWVGGHPCANGLLVENTTITGPKYTPLSYQEGHITYGGYTARNVELNGVDEGFRVSGVGCGPVTIEDSFVKVDPPPGCGDWHGDGIQSYGGQAVTVRNTTIDMRASFANRCFGTAPFFRPSGQGNVGDATINGLLVMGQGFPFRLGTTGTVSGLKIVDGSWVFGPIDVKCSIISSWEAKIVTIDSNYQPTTVRDQPCNTEGGG